MDTDQVYTLEKPFDLLGTLQGSSEHANPATQTETSAQNTRDIFGEFSTSKFFFAHQDKPCMASRSILTTPDGESNIFQRTNTVYVFLALL